MNKLLTLLLLTLSLFLISACNEKKAPEFSLLSATSNKQIKLSDHKGKLVLLNFWASWCPPCIAEIPGFIKVQEEYKEKGFTIIGLAMEHPKAALKYAQKIGINYPIAAGTDKVHDVASAYGNPDGGLPYTVLISPEQTILSVYAGFLSEEKLKKMLDKHLPK